MYRVFDWILDGAIMLEEISKLPVILLFGSFRTGEALGSTSVAV